MSAGKAYVAPAIAAEDELEHRAQFACQIPEGWESLSNPVGPETFCEVNISKDGMIFTVPNLCSDVPGDGKPPPVVSS